MDGNFSASEFGQQPLISYAPPSGFSAAQDGIYVDTVGRDGEITSEWLCSPLAVVAIGRNVQQTGWSRCIEFIDPEGVVQRLYALEKDLAAGFTKVLAELCDRGLRIARGTAVRRRLHELIASWAPVGRYETTDRLGWADASCSAFILGDKRVIGKANTVFLSAAVRDGSLAMCRQGTLDQWRGEVAARCKGNPILIASLSLAFSGPLLELLGKDSLGMHLRGSSSSGKTTAMGAAVSVWGSPNLMHSWRATANALEGVAASCNGSLLALDELGLVSAREVEDAVYTLANGQGKARSSSSGRLQPMQKWRLAVLSTGEISLAEKMAEVGRSPMKGQEVRLVDIAADTRRHGVFDNLHGSADSASFARDLKQAAAATYGMAGAELVRVLVAYKKRRDNFNRFISNRVDDWKGSLGVDGDGPTERVLGHFAVIALAGELATKAGITGWEKGAAMEALLMLARDWCDTQDRSEQWQILAALERTRSYLRSYGATRFEMARGTPIADRAGYRDGKWFYILGDAWNAIHAGHSPTDQARHLIVGKWMVSGDGKNLMSKTPGWVPGRPRAYKVRAEILAPDSGELVSV